MKSLAIILLIFSTHAFVHAQLFEDHFEKIWDSQIPLFQNEAIRDVKFIDSTYGLILTRTLGANQALNEYRTFDGGYSWSKTTIPNLNGTSTEIEFDGNNYTYAFIQFGQDVYGDSGSIIVFREIDYNSNYNSLKTVPIPAAIYISDISLSNYTSTKKYLTVRNFVNLNEQINGIFYTSNNFDSLIFISNHTPYNICEHSGKSYYFHDNTIYKILEGSIEKYSECYIHCSSDMKVKVMKNQADLFVYYDLKCHDQIGAHNLFNAGIQQIIPQNQEIHFLRTHSLKNQLFGDTLFWGTSQPNKYILGEDSSLAMNEIGRTGFGDLKFVDNYYYSQFINDSVAFVFSYINNEDSTWCLFKTTTGQPGYKTYIGHGTAEINEIRTEQRSISIYPNPTVGNIQIDFGNLEESVEFQIYDSQGKILLTGNSSESILEVPLSDLGPGIYHLRIIDHDKEVLLHERIVKQ
ncbi:MAG: T9SS type A sorting domain-containing protein [Crocinitomicaceae bacterium]|jgi:hypothetical protein|nr:T9SS type A sorting domain-containing protein [Crocinitomicaceae bacterium]